jgi:3-hydroxyacyl-[acyl-carrier-protein] dehydratase
MRWLWIDRFLEFNPRTQAKAVKNLSWAEDHFRDHFPGYPVMPGSLMLEGLAQTGGILVGEAMNFEQNVVLAKVGQAKFHREALAGEQLIYEVTVIDLRPEGSTVQGKVTAAGELIVEAEIMFAHIDQAKAKAMFGQEHFVFAGDLKKLLGLTRLLKEPATN